MNLILANTIDIKNIIFLLLGGLAIFLYGINLMGDYLKKIAGSRLRLILEKTTNTPIKGILTGAILTVLIQSSSATTAIVVGLVSAGLLSLPNAIGVVLGAKIGTTITSVLISFNLGDYAMPIVFIGAILLIFFKKKRIQNIGGAILGFGLLFLGLNIMGSSFDGLAQTKAFEAFLLSATKSPILGVLIGVVATALVQSSSATIGILQKLYTTGAVPLIVAVAIVLGSNIGTTITAIVSSLKGNKNGKKVALIYVIFNVSASILFLILLNPYTKLINWLSELMRLDPTTSMFTVSLSHILFNLLSVLILAWFIKQFIWIANKLIKDDGDSLTQEVVLDRRLLKASPELALENVSRAIKEMGELAIKMVDYAHDYAFEKEEKSKELGFQIEEILNHLDVDIHNYLVELTAQNLTERQTQKVAKHIDTVKDLERIGDHLENLIEFFEAKWEDKSDLPYEAKEELLHLFNIVNHQLKDVLTSYFNDDVVLASKVEKCEFELNRLVKEYRNNHIMRISENTTDSKINYYVDIISNLERIGDHCYNIAENVLYKKFTYKKKEVRA